jgi:hypothetical protein
MLSCVHYATEMGLGPGDVCLYHFPVHTRGQACGSHPTCEALTALEAPQ